MKISPSNISSHCFVISGMPFPKGPFLLFPVSSIILTTKTHACRHNHFLTNTPVFTHTNINTGAKRGLYKSLYFIWWTQWIQGGGINTQHTHVSEVGYQQSINFWRCLQGVIKCIVRHKHPQTGCSFTKAWNQHGVFTFFMLVSIRFFFFTVDTISVQPRSAILTDEHTQPKSSAFLRDS